MSGYPEDGMSIGVGVGQLAPWMMPPEDFQAPASVVQTALQANHATVAQQQQHHQHQQQQHQQQQLQQLQQQFVVKQEASQHALLNRSQTDSTNKMMYRPQVTSTCVLASYACS